MALAMLYMYLAAVPASGRAGTAVMAAPTGAAANFVGLPLLFVAILFASAIWQLDGLSRYAATGPDLVGVASLGPQGGPARAQSPPTTSSPGFPVAPASPAGSVPEPSLAPRLEMGCHIAMCITMGYMLILML